MEELFEFFCFFLDSDMMIGKNCLNSFISFLDSDNRKELFEYFSR